MTTFVAHTRARDDRRFQRAAAQTDLREAPGGAAAAGRTMVRSPACAVEIFVLANLVGTTMELRRSGRSMMMFVAIFGADAGARAIELRGRQRRQPGSKAAQTGSTACSRSDICGWRSGVLYPLAGGDRESGAAHLDLQTDPQPPPGRCSGLRPHDGDVAGGAGFLCSDIRGRRWSSGDRATGSTAPTARIESRADWVYGVLSLRHLRLAIWCSLSLGGW